MQPRPLTPPAGVSSSKIHYLDSIKVLLTGLVVLHHVSLAYGAPGGWYFKEPIPHAPTQFVLLVFVATNQSFFMGLFFMLSAYFIEPSYQRKGASVFILDRLKRLGIPLVFYSLVLATAINFLVYRYGLHQKATLWQFLGGYDDWINPGVMWFVAALLLFTLVYAALWRLAPLRHRIGLPGLKGILVFAIGLGLVSFLVRLVFPIGWVLDPLGFQLCYFPQYIALFTVGVLARQNHWFEQLPYGQGKRFARLAAVLVVVGLPLMLWAGRRESADAFRGGWNWQALGLSLWEQLTGLALIVVLLTYGKRHWNADNFFLNRLARYAYAVYIFHPLVIVVLSLLLSRLPIEPPGQLAVAAPLAVIGSFLVGRGVFGLPGAGKIL